MEINIGDTVRFLNAVGGGKVTGFDKGGLVLVEDEDGFEIPVRSCEVVVVPQERHQSRQPTVVEEPAVKAQSQPVPSKPERNDLEKRIILLEMTVSKLEMRLERLEQQRQQHEQQKHQQLQQLQQLQQSDIIEVDLHIGQLLDSTQGMSPADIKSYQLKIFRQTMQQYQGRKGQRIVFIHGNGDGVLRKALLDELKYAYKTCSWQDASFQQYGFGATMVTIR